MSSISRSFECPLRLTVARRDVWPLLHAGIIVALSVCTAVHAAQPVVTITQTYDPTPGLPGYTTWVLTAHSELPIMDFDFIGFRGDNDPSVGLGFFGPLNQVHPFRLSTVYQDLNPVFPLVGADVKQDSQFLAVTTGNMVTGSIFREDSPSVLQGAFGRFMPPLGNTVPFVQLVIPHGGRVTYRGKITDVNLRTTLVSGELVAPPVPEPASIVLAGLGLMAAGLARRCRRRRVQY